MTKPIWRCLMLALWLPVGCNHSPLPSGNDGSGGGGSGGGGAGGGGAGGMQGPAPAWHLEWSGPPLTGNVPTMLTAVWGSSANDVYAVGESGLILHSTGNGQWVKQPSGIPTHLWSIWGRAPNDLFVGTSGGSAPSIYHSTGDGKWTAQTTPMWQNGQVVAFIGNSSSILAAVLGGYFLQPNGDGSWSIAPTATTLYLQNAWGNDPGGDLFTVGPQGIVQHRIAGVWQNEKSNVPSFQLPCANVGPCDPAPETPAFDSVWGSPDGAVYAVGQAGLILRSDGKGNWSIERNEEPSLVPEYRRVWGSSANDIYVAGNEIVMHSTGDGQWSKVDVGAADQFFGIWGTSWRDIYIVGGKTILHYH